MSTYSTVGQCVAKSVLSALYIPMYFRTLCHCTSTVQYSVQYIGQCVSKSDLSTLYNMYFSIFVYSCTKVCGYSHVASVITT